MAAKAELRRPALRPAEGCASRSVAVGSRGEVEPEADGPHILLSGMKKQLSPYDSFLMTLRFERAGKVEVEVMVEEASVDRSTNKTPAVTRNQATGKEINHAAQGSRRVRLAGGARFRRRGAPSPMRDTTTAQGEKGQEIKAERRPAIEFTVRRETA